MAPTIADVEAARERLAGIARETPLYPTETFSRLTGRQVYPQGREPPADGLVQDPRRLQHDRDARRGRSARAGVVAASAGNHGQAVAWAAREAGISATIFMPQDAPMAKVEATRSYGGATELAGEGFEEAVAAAQAHVERTGATLVHAFEDERVIAGQGTIGLELAEQAPDAETVLIPIGGGGLAAGIALALKERRPACRADRRDLPARLHDRRRDRRQAPGRSAVVDPRAASSTTPFRSRTRRSPRRSCSAWSERSSSSRAPARSGSRRSSRAGCPGAGPSPSSSRAGTSTRRRSSPCCATG